MSKLLDEMLVNFKNQMGELLERVNELEELEDIDVVERQKQMSIYKSQMQTLEQKVQICVIVTGVLGKYSPMVDEFLPVIKEIVSENQTVVTGLLGLVMDSYCDCADDLKEQRLRMKKLTAENLRAMYDALKAVKFTNDQAMAILLAKIPSSNLLQNIGKGIGQGVQARAKSSSKS